MLILGKRLILRPFRSFQERHLVEHVEKRLWQADFADAELPGRNSRYTRRSIAPHFQKFRWAHPGGKLDETEFPQARIEVIKYRYFFLYSRLHLVNVEA